MRYVIDINAQGGACSTQVEVEADSIEEALRNVLWNGKVEEPRVLSGNAFEPVRRNDEAIRRLGGQAVPHFGRWVRVSFNILVGGYDSEIEISSDDMFEEDTPFCSDDCRTEI